MDSRIQAWSVIVQKRDSKVAALWLIDNVGWRGVEDVEETLRAAYRESPTIIDKVFEDDVAMGLLRLMGFSNTRERPQGYPLKLKGRPWWARCRKGDREFYHEADTVDDAVKGMFFEIMEGREYAR